MSRPTGINRNIVWAEAFVDALVRSGVTDVCISPGSRSTPLTVAFARHSAVRAFVHVDERSGAFFALGLAKNLRRPVALVCTSGTAAAEFQPAIIEAYQSRVPLIVCTADRPPEAQDAGANQTINQRNLYRNHIRWYFDVGLPEVTALRLRHIRGLARRAVYEASGRIPGPVHLNFPFRKPFEPDAATDRVDLEMLYGETSEASSSQHHSRARPDDSTMDFVTDFVATNPRGLITVGPNDFGDSFSESVTALSAQLGYPILADAASGLRWGRHSKVNICTHYNGYLGQGAFAREQRPDVVFHFGSMMSSAGLERYLTEQLPAIYYVSRYGEWYDPINSIKDVITSDPDEFCSAIIQRLRTRDVVPLESWMSAFEMAENHTANLRASLIDCTEILFEGKVFKVLFDALPEDTNVFVSNSMPVRDMDYFAPARDKKLQIHVNRGASGIDGITSTALGVAAASQNPTVLVTGDLAFYHDLNGLIAATQYGIPLLVVLINNSGGGIFEMLPIADHTEVFETYFATPLPIDFQPIVQGYGGALTRMESWAMLSEAIRNQIGKPGLNVLELKTDRKKSAAMRRQFTTELLEKLAQIRV